MANLNDKMQQAKDATVQMAKQQVKKVAKKVLMLFIKNVLPWLIIACIFLTIVTSIKQGMVELLNAVQTRVTSFFTFFLDNDWIDLSEKHEYTIEDKSTGQSQTVEYTIIEKYIRDLAVQGISLKELRILGDFQFTEEEQKLPELELVEKIILNEGGKYTQQKELIEKYITEFIRADLITQSIHRRRGLDLVSGSKEELIDGGVYLYRAQRANISEDTALENGMYTTTLDDAKYVKMEYMKYDEFNGKVEDTSLSDSAKEKLRYKFTIDPSTGDLLYVQIKTVEKKEGDVSNSINEFFIGTVEKKVELTLVRVDYKQYISKYTMPYEFLINLCMITQNPEFVYHVALLARDTKIVLAIQDDETIETVTTNREKTYVDYKNEADNKVSGASVTNTNTKKTREITITTTTNASNLRVRYADAWTFYEEFQYVNTITTETEPQTPQISDGEVDTYTILPDYHPATEGYNETIEGDMGADTTVWHPGTSEYWTADNYLISHKVSTQTVTTTNTYKVPDKAEPSIEKSKQFLGLLVNASGKCLYDCYDDTNTAKWKNAKECVKNAVYYDQGIKVAYEIPNVTNGEEIPLNKLQSGLQMLYQLLGYDGSTTGEATDDENGEYTVDEDTIQAQIEQDVNSLYNQRMQKIAEHLQYLMTFPPNESYDLINDQLMYSNGSNVNNGEYGSNDNFISHFSQFWWPLDESVECRISSHFGLRDAPVEGASTNHKGIDIACVTGSPVIASADGTVITSGFSGSAGERIQIDHGNGFITQYMHLSQRIVSEGDTVTQGQVIGYSGNTGTSTGAHLHFGMKLNGQYVDPENYVSISNKRPIVDSITIEDDEKLDIIYAIVASESASSYEGALAVITCALNRCNSDTWAHNGKDPYSQLTASGQFSYGISQYADAHKKYLNGMAPDCVKQAVNDALNNGVRNHNFTSFRTDTEETRKSHPNGQSIGGNWYFS